MSILDKIPDGFWSLFKINKTDPKSLKAFKLICYCILTVSMVIGVVVPAFSPLWNEDKVRVKCIRGSVHTIEDKPLSKATVKIDGTQYSTETDNFGMYVINRLDNYAVINPVKLVISKQGYQDFIRSVEIEEPHVFMDVYLRQENKESK